MRVVVAKRFSGSFASISATGEVNPCSFLGTSFESGNVRDRPFREIWDAGAIVVS